MFAIKTKVATFMYKKKFVSNGSTALLVRPCFLSDKGKIEKRNPQWFQRSPKPWPHCWGSGMISLRIRIRLLIHFGSGSSWPKS
jgi:hypothetical protein